MNAILLLVGLPLLLVALLAVGLAVSYNRFVRQRNLVRESWRQVDVELQRRHDLVPTLVQTVSAYAGQERAVLEGVVQARNRAEEVRRSPGITAAAQGEAEGRLGRAVGGLLAVAEAYPDLRSNQGFLALQHQLAETEDRVAAGRRFYNANVRAVNTRVEAFPSNLVASVFGFRQEEYFEVDDPATRAPVAVDFSGLGQVPPTPHAVAPQLPPGPGQGAQPA